MLLVRDEVKLDRRAAGTLAVDRHLAGISTKRRNVRLDPAERHALVLEAGVHVTEGRVLQEFGRGEEPDRVEAVVDGCDDNVWRLMDPIVEWPVGRVPVDITYSSWKDR